MAFWWPTDCGLIFLGLHQLILRSCALVQQCAFMHSSAKILHLKASKYNSMLCKTSACTNRKSIHCILRKVTLKNIGFGVKNSYTVSRSRMADL